MTNKIAMDLVCETEYQFPKHPLGKRPQRWRHLKSHALLGFATFEPGAFVRLTGANDKSDELTK